MGLKTRTHWNQRAIKRGAAALLFIVLSAVLYGSVFASPASHAEGAHPVSATEAQSFTAQLTEAANRWGAALQARDGNTLISLLAGDTPAERHALFAALTGVDLPESGDFGVSNPWIEDFVVTEVDPEMRSAVVVLAWKGADAPGWRSALRLIFTKQDAIAVQSLEKLVPASEMGVVDALDTFLLLYGNDLGLPDGFQMQLELENDWGEPQEATERLLHLTGGTWTADEAYYAGNKPTGSIRTYRFADGQKLHFVMDQWPKDWYLEDGSNQRTPTDLARQWARGLNYKSGWYRYPLLSAAEQKKFVEAQIADTGYGEGNWSWKIGGSSPSVFAWSVVSATDRQALLVYVAKDSLPQEYRFTETLTFARDPHGRLTVIGTDQGYGYIPFDFAVLPDGYPMLSDEQRFALFYGHGLPLPSFDSDALAFFAQPENATREAALALRDPAEAVKWLFNFGGTEAVFNFDGTEAGRFHVDALHTTMEGDAAAVTATFQDGGAVTIHMKQQEGYAFWLPERWQIHHDAGGKR